VVLISLLKHTKKDFQIIIAFGHDAFVTSQSLFVPTNIVLKRHLACQTFSNESCLSIRIYQGEPNLLYVWGAYCKIQVTKSRNLKT